MLNRYLDIIPSLENLADKDFKVRHWMRLMQVCQKRFPLEASVFKTVYVLDLDLQKYKSELADIYLSARKEAQLELNLKTIEEEFTEATLSFTEHQSRGPMLLDEQMTTQIIVAMTTAQSALADMLTLKHHTPYRDRITLWAERLRTVVQVLHVWLSAQEFWSQLEALFNATCSDSVPKKLREIYYIFESVDRAYMKIMKKNYNTKNVLQCCFTADSNNMSLYQGFVQQFESCLADCHNLLDSLFDQWPRAGLLNREQLLSLLAAPRNLATGCSAKNVEPLLPLLFPSIASIIVKKNDLKSLLLVDGLRKNHLDTKHSTRIISVISEDGEECSLIEPIEIESTCIDWLQALDESLQDTMEKKTAAMINSLGNGMQLEELALADLPAQVLQLGLHLLWTMDAENGIRSLRTGERRGLENAQRTFYGRIQRLPAILSRAC
ncbi:hypothetical protein Ciccas_000066, partial [Cichlidogyrus casuarinus]